MGTAFYRRRWFVALGRRPGLALAIARFCVAIAYLAECHIGGGGSADGWNAACNFFLAYLAWAIFCPAISATSWTTAVRVWPAILIGDWLICTAMVLVLKTYVLPALLMAILVLTAMRWRFGMVLTALSAAMLGAAYVARGLVGPALFSVPFGLAPHPGISAASVLIAAFVALALASANHSDRDFRSWGDELLMVGSNFRSLPIDFLLQRLGDFFGAHQVAFLWREEEGAPVSLSVHEAGRTANLARLDGNSAGLMATETVDGVFLFDNKAGALLARDAHGHPAVIEAPGLTGHIAEAFAGMRGSSFPVRSGDLYGRVYVMGPGAPSEVALLDVEKAAELTEGVFDRYFFLSAWRARAVVEARHALSRDLHDSVLQTLAAMRMQIAALIADEESDTLEERRAKLAALQSVIVAEQARLRDILDETYRTARLPTDLVVQLGNCVAYLSEQWEVECKLLAQDAALPVDSDTAVEVEFLVREAVANAVQHAGAKRLALVVAVDHDTLFLSLRNQGRARRGAATAKSEARISIDSRSLTRRLTSLGGSAYSEEIGSGSLLAMQIPLKRG